MLNSAALLTCVLQGCQATICMPINTPDIKVANVRRLGGLVELVGESYQEAQAYAQVHRISSMNVQAAHTHFSATRSSSGILSMVVKVTSVLVWGSC
jgi:cysteine synthase